MAEQSNFTGDEFPSLDLAYEFIIPSYDWALRRLDAVERRIESLIVIVTATTGTAILGVIALAQKTGLDFSLCRWEVWVGLLAFLCFVLSMALGFYARHLGRVTFLDPAFFGTISETPAVFRWNAVQDASEDLRKHADLVARKSRWADWVLIPFIVEVLLVAVLLVSLLSS